MPLLTDKPIEAPAKLARAQIEQELRNALDSAKAHHDRLGAMLYNSETGATSEEIIAEFGEDAPLLLEVRKKSEEVMAAIDPTLADTFAMQALSGGGK